ncbi:MAG: hypothetical protein WDA65_08450 [Christensenellales bacterium]
MANVSVFDMGAGAPAVLETDTVAPAAARQQVPCRKDSRLCVRVCNADAQTDVIARVKAGGGPRAALGDMDIAVDAGETAYIALWDTARFKDMENGTVTVEMLDADEEQLDAQALANVSIEAVQL